MRRRNPFIARLIDAARGGDTGASSSSSYQLPCFPLESHHFGQLLTDACQGVVATPSDFHSYLCNRIRTAQERVVLASLYIGVGSSNSKYQSISSSCSISNKFYHCKEDELLQSISDATAPKIQILLDANRAMRRVSLTAAATTTTNNDLSTNNNNNTLWTNSAEAVYSRMNPRLGKCQKNSGVYLFPVKDERISRILPSPLDEVVGVFHIKAYIVDDELILSGANLSEEYFSNRLDRYMLFTNGGAGLVDFYANLCDILCDYATRYDGHSENMANSGPMLTSRHDEKARKRKLELALMNLFHNANNQHVQQHHNVEEENDKVVAWAIPTIQIPTKLLGSINIPSDTKVTRSILSLALHGNELSLASVRVCSAYLNLTDNLMSVLTKNHGGMTNSNNARASYILTAGEMSHGFSPKRGGGTKHDKKSGIVEYIKAAIPTAFLALAKKTAQSIVASGGKIFLYERPGWIFHAKGIWITINDYDHDATTTTHPPNLSNPEIIDNPSCLVATIIGSSNFGSRSENLDLESNCILIFNDSMTKSNNEVKQSVAAEWNKLCEQSNVLSDVNVDISSNDIIMHFLLKLIRRYL